MSFSVSRFRRSAAPAAMTAVAGVYFLFSGTLLGADSVTAPAGSSSQSPSGDSASATISISPDSLESPSSERHVNFPDRSQSMQDLFNRHRTGPLPGPQPSQAPIRRPRNLLEDPNWGLVTPEDIVKEYMAKQVLKMPDYGSDGRDRSSMSAMELYYDRQNRPKFSPSNPGGESFSPGNLFGNGSGSGSVGGFNGINSPASMNALDNPNLSGSAVRPDVLSDVLGMRNNPMSPNAIRERDVNQRQMEAFKRALDYQPSLPTPQSTAVSPPAPSRTWGGGNGNFTPVLPANPFDHASGTYNPALATIAPIAPVAPVAPTAPGQSLSSAMPTYPSSRPAPPRLEFSIPQRRF